jgi:enolase
MTTIEANVSTDTIITKVQGRCVDSGAHIEASMSPAVQSVTIAPAGASRGSHEPSTCDGGQAFGGMAYRKRWRVNNEISRLLLGRNALRQAE